MDRLPNLVVLTVDALRQDHCSIHGYHRDTTPELDAFGRDNCSFETAVAASSHTREAAPPIITGLWPEAFRANGFTQVEEPLPAALQAAGYRTGAFHSNPYLSRAYDYDRGFEAFFDDLYLARHRLIALAQKAIDKYLLRKGEYYARAPELNRRALEWLDSLDDEPFFLYTHYMDVHGPYHAPERRFAERSLSASEAEDLYRRSWTDPDTITDDERQLLIDSYDDEIRSLDAEIGEFLEALDRRDLLEETLVVITADHGDAFGEHGYYTHPRRLDDALLRVPLFVSTPQNHGAEIDAPVSTIDVGPTLATAAGIEHDLPGEPLVEGAAGPACNGDRRVFASVTPDPVEGRRRFAVRSGEWLLRQERAIETNEVHSEQALAVGDADGAVPDELRAALDLFATERLRELGATDIYAETATTDEIESRLKTLGYK